MNNLGKFLLIPLIIILSLLGFFWAGKLLKQRNDLASSFDSVLKQNIANSEALESKTIERNKLMHQITRENHGWDETFENKGISVPPQGQVQLLGSNLGTNDGLKVAQGKDANGQDVQVNPHIFGFFNAGDQVRYAGEYEIVNLAAQQAGLRPTWFYTAQDVNVWRSAANSQWHFRAEIPQHFRSRIEALHARSARAIQRGQSLQMQIKVQTELIELANKDLNVRTGELLGNPEIERTEDRPELAIGLVAAIEEAEEFRNDLQSAVDTLRREIKVESDFQQATITELQDEVGESSAARISRK